jgi:predicted Zn finger-like uncharacterized protein
MFTVCPKCALTLVVTAADLRVAQGYVRCGRCSSVFNALAQLSDDRSTTAAGEGEPRSEEPEAEEPESTSPAAADEESNESASPAAADEEATESAPPAVEDDESIPEYTLEFNPETTDAASLFVVAAPSPEWTAATGSFKQLAAPEQQPAAAAPEPPAPRAAAPESRAAAPEPAAAAPDPRPTALPPLPKTQDADQDFEVELDAALLSDIVQSELVPEKLVPPAREPPAPAESERTSAAARRPGHNRPEAPGASTRPPASAASTPAPTTAAKAPAGSASRASAAPAARTPPATTARTAASPAGPTPAAAAARTPPVTPAGTAAASAARTSAAPAAKTPAATTGKTSPAPAARTPPDSEAATAAAPAARTPPASTAPATATEAVPHSDGAPDPHAPGLSDDVAFADLEAAAGAAEQHAGRPRWQWTAGSALLVFILFAQIINHQRDALATDPRFSGSLTAVYTALGVQLTPRWDLRAYDVRQLGASVEAGGTGAITVRASIRNAGTKPQPLPLLRVTLQDRFGNRLASRDVQPRDYLPSGTAPAALLARDQRVDAELAFVDPGASAVGFELDACLPLGGGIVCANDTSAIR